MNSAVSRTGVPPHSLGIDSLYTSLPTPADTKTVDESKAYAYCDAKYCFSCLFLCSSFCLLLFQLQNARGRMQEAVSQNVRGDSVVPGEGSAGPHAPGRWACGSDAPCRYHPL